ncbi:MAG: 4Fe-4S ferredoxin [Desulfatitalea sp.]|nr:4Fe-4S ferredoxin [Desulfatitalea sp.]NNK00531.1 4Fe-4S ferredoxin [Desulfatitalea sp.]
MKFMRKIVQIDEEKCDGCGNCIMGCAEGALALVDGKAKVISDNLCDGLGACIGECPQDALRIIEREAEAFDEDAVEVHLEARHQHTAAPQAKMACGCPSTQIQSFAPCSQANQPIRHGGAPDSALTHWPVQIRLVPPTAPFLKGADLLVAADCVPVALPSFHQELLQGKTVMLGCPKFDDSQAYVDRFAEIFKTAGIKSITAVVMEVPCCDGLPLIVKQGMEKAGVHLPINKVVVSTRGKILETRKVA